MLPNYQPHLHVEKRHWRLRHGGIIILPNINEIQYEISPGTSRWQPHHYNYLPLDNIFADYQQSSLET